MSCIATFVEPHALDREAWKRIVEQTPGCSVELHPDLLPYVATGARQSRIYVDCREDKVQSLAVLVPRAVRPLHRTRQERMIALEGMRLVASQLAGRSDADAWGRFGAALRELLTYEAIDCLCIEDAEVGSHLWNTARTVAAGSALMCELPMAPEAHWLIRFTKDNPEAYWEDMSRPSRAKLRRAARRFTHRATAITAPEQVESFLFDAVRVSEHSWQRQQLGMRIAMDEYHRGYLGALARLGALRSYLLYHGDLPVAFACGWQWNGRYACWEAGYDRRYARYRPGMVLLYRMIEDMLAHRCPATLDLGPGHAMYKQIFGNHEHTSGPIAVFAPRAHARLALALRQARRTTEHEVCENLRRTRLFEHARRLAG